MSVRAYAEIAIDLSHQLHRCLIQLDQESNKLGMVMPRTLRYAAQDLRFAHLRVRDELRYMLGETPDTVRADPNGEVTFELQRGS